MRSEPDAPDYRMFPRVVPEGWSGELQVSGDYAHSTLVPGVKYKYELCSMRWCATSRRKRKPVAGVLAADRRGRLAVPFEPDIGGEWVLTVTSEDKRIRRLPVLGLYVIREEDRSLRPYIGELHAHSTGSDGRQEPAYCPIRARALGYDFFTLTDHDNYHSSGEMLRKVRGKLGTKMLLMRGEECHCPPAPFHYVAVGHARSIEDIRKQDEARYRKELRALARELRKGGPVQGLNVSSYAAGLWKMRKARELGGLVLYAHPYWSYRGTLCVDTPQIEQTFRDGEFDAVEVRTTADASSMMPSRVAYEAGQGRPKPVVGVSDSHDWADGGTAGRHWTYVFAKELTQDGIFDAIRAGRSLACEDVGGRLALVGPFELVEFAHFYHRRLAPLKKRIMELEAALAFSALRRGPYDRGVVEKLDRELDRLEKKTWA